MEKEFSQVPILNVGGYAVDGLGNFDNADGFGVILDDFSRNRVGESYDYVVNMSGVELPDASYLGVMVDRIARDGGARMMYIRANGDFLKQIEVAKLEELFEGRILGC